ncbi:MAG: ATP-binding protein [Bacteroidota bacterium]|nr:ATP-binding protein [Candidatus Kapabacteria bacterium]MDW8221155.1 ATP-binding protein [Bacteroidota bacterium]
MLQLSFRLRLTLWYTALVALPLAGVIVFAYTTVQRELNGNLDSSLQRVAESLDFIIRKKQSETRQPLLPSQSERPRRDKETNKIDYFEFFRAAERRRFVGPVLPRKDTAQQSEEKADIVWSAVYEHILLNPKNYLIQVADSLGRIVWRSDNLVKNKQQLPLPSAGMLEGDTFPFRYTIPTFPLGKQLLRMFVLHTGTVQVSVGYPVEELETTLNDLFFSLVLALPCVLLLALIIGWLLAKYFVQPVEEITRLADEITEHNLSQRLPIRRVNDEITRLTHTLNAMIERLERSFAQIRQFTGDASHELRTPLAILMGELEMALHADKSPREYQETIASALEEVSRLSQVVKNLLELSRADAGQATLDLEELSLSALMENLVEDAMILAEEKNITVSANVESAVIIHGDRVRLHQALLNVIDNAIKYTDSGGRITVGLRTQGNEVLVSVSDSGCGIPSEDIPHIFDRFYRVDKSRSSVNGHGLGLSIVKWVIEAHKGRIKVTSTLGKGTIFLIWLPCVSTEQRLLTKGYIQRAVL